MHPTAELFTEKAWAAVVDAQQRAQQARQQQMESEHLLAALIGQQDLASRILAKAGVEDGAGLIGGSVIVDPNGMILAQAKTLEDEIIIAECDFEKCMQGKGPGKIFDFGFHRRPQHYGRIVEQAGVEPIA
jgi:predicted amidohydrolase